MEVGNKGTAVATWYSAQPVGVSMPDHFMSIQDMIAQADVALYQNTMKYSATYILCGMNALRFFGFCRDFKAASAKTAVGPYVAGTVLGKTIVVSPAVPANKIYFGVNTPDASAVIYAVYMPEHNGQLDSNIK